LILCKSASAVGRSKVAIQSTLPVKAVLADVAGVIPTMTTHEFAKFPLLM